MRSKGRVFLVEWDALSAEARAATLRSAKWDVEVEYEDGEEAYRRMAGAPPEVAVFEMSRRPSHGRATARAFAGLKGARETTIIFLDAPDRAAILTDVPAAHFTTSDGLLPALEALGIPERLNKVIGGLHDTEMHEPPDHGIGSVEDPAKPGPVPFPLNDPLTKRPTDPQKEA